MMHEFETRAIHAGHSPSNEAYRPLIPPITYTGNEAPGGNRVLKCLEDSIASLEYAKHALCYPSGQATSSSIIQTLGTGGHAVVFDSVYHGTRTNFDICEKEGKIEVTFLDLRDASVLEDHLRDNTKIVWIETPSNPTMKILDIAAIAEIVKKRKRNIILAVDNTFMTPYFQNPLLLGVDIVMHSLTKFINGHSDCLMGAIATNDKELFETLKDYREASGIIPSPMDCFLVLRGLKTLQIRMERHMQNAMAIAEFLEKHPKVERVFYPGLPSHPQHALAKRQCKGFSAMVSFRIRGSTEETKVFAQNIKLFKLAVSLGSAESLIDIPSLMTASVLTKEKQRELEITDNLLRMSIGIEAATDLIADLYQALNKV